MRNWRKIIAIILIICLCTSLFSGCSAEVEEEEIFYDGAFDKVQVDGISVDTITLDQLTIETITLDSIYIEEITLIEIDMMEISDEMLTIIFNNLDEYYEISCDREALKEQLAVAAVAVVVVITVSVATAGAATALAGTAAGNSLSFIGTVCFHQSAVTAGSTVTSAMLSAAASTTSALAVELAIGAGVDAAISGVIAAKQGEDINGIVDFIIEGVVDGLMYSALFAPVGFAAEYGIGQLISAIATIKTASTAVASIKSIGAIRSNVSDATTKTFLKNSDEFFTAARNLVEETSTARVTSVYEEYMEAMAKRIDDSTDVFFTEMTQEAFEAMIVKSSDIYSIVINKNVYDLATTVQEVYRLDYLLEKGIADDVAEKTISAISAGTVVFADLDSTVQALIKSDSTNFIKYFSYSVSSDFVKDILKAKVGSIGNDLVEFIITSGNKTSLFIDAIEKFPNNISDLVDIDNALLITSAFSEKASKNYTYGQALYNVLIDSGINSDDAVSLFNQFIGDGVSSLSYFSSFGNDVAEAIVTNKTALSSALSGLSTTGQNKSLVNEIVIRNLSEILPNQADNISAMISGGYGKNEIVAKCGNLFYELSDNFADVAYAMSGTLQDSKSLMKELFTYTLTNKNISSTSISSIVNLSGMSSWGVSNANIYNIFDEVYAYYSFTGDLSNTSFVSDFASLILSNQDEFISAYVNKTINYAVSYQIMQNIFGTKTDDFLKYIGNNLQEPLVDLINRGTITLDDMYTYFSDENINILRYLLGDDVMDGIIQEQNIVTALRQQNVSDDMILQIINHTSVDELGITDEAVLAIINNREEIYRYSMQLILRNTDVVNSTYVTLRNIMGSGFGIDDSVFEIYEWTIRGQLSLYDEYGMLDDIVDALSSDDVDAVLRKIYSGNLSIQDVMNENAFVATAQMKYLPQSDGAIRALYDSSPQSTGQSAEWYVYFKEYAGEGSVSRQYTIMTEFDGEVNYFGTSEIFNSDIRVSRKSDIVVYQANGSEVHIEVKSGVLADSQAYTIRYELYGDIYGLESNLARMQEYRLYTSVTDTNPSGAQYLENSTIANYLYTMKDMFPDRVSVFLDDIELSLDDIAQYCDFSELAAVA